MSRALTQRVESLYRARVRVLDGGLVLDPFDYPDVNRAERHDDRPIGYRGIFQRDIQKLFRLIESAKKFHPIASKIRCCPDSTRESSEITRFTPQ